MTKAKDFSLAATRVFRALDGTAPPYRHLEPAYPVPGPLDVACIGTDTSDRAQGCRIGTTAANRSLIPYLFTFDGTAYQIASPGGAFSDWAGYWALVMPAAANAGASLSFGKRPG